MLFLELLAAGRYRPPPRKILNTPDISIILLQQSRATVRMLYYDGIIPIHPIRNDLSSLLGYETPIIQSDHNNTTGRAKSRNRPILL